MKRLKVIIVLLLFLLIGAGRVGAQQEQAAAWQVVRYDINVNLPNTSATERALTARVSIQARNVGGAGRTFTVRASPGVEVKAASVNDAAAQFVVRPEGRTKLQQATVSLPSVVPPGGAVNVAVEYRMAIAANSGLAALSPEGAQFLPLSHWLPTPNTQYAPRGADAAPFRLTVNGAGGDTVVSTGQSQGATFEQPLNAQPFFLTGRWDAVEGAGEARGVSALLLAGASAEERKRGEALVALASAARSFYAGLLGPAPDVPVRLVAARRGAGFDMAGTLLLDPAAFRRTKTDAETAMQVAVAVARLWIGGAAGVQGENAGVIREGLARYLATLFIEKQFGATAADEQRMRMALAYVLVAQRDAPLSQASPFFGDYDTSVANKGALVWRLVANAVGRENFMSVLRGAIEAGRRGDKLTLASLRAALGEATNESLRRLLTSAFDQTTDTDLLVGLPQQRAGEWVSALRNTGSIDVTVPVMARAEGGERLSVQVTIPAKDFAEARFKTASRLARVEVDPEKLYPQLDYSNDVAPRGPSTQEALAQLPTQFAQQQYSNVEATARELLRLDPNMQDAHAWLGRALLEQNRLDEAEREFRAAYDSALPTRRTLAWSSHGLGETAARRRNVAEAVRRFDEAARAEADYGSTLDARLARIRAESAAPPAPDEQARAFVAQLDQAIQSGRKAALEALIVPGELAEFVRGIVANQPELWQTRAVRTEPLGANLMYVDVQVAAKLAERENAGPAVLLLVRTSAGWRLAALPIFEVKPRSDV